MGESPHKLMADLRARVMSQEGIMGSVQYRAERIARTEISRIHAMGNQQRMQQFTREWPRYRMKKALLVSEVGGWPCEACEAVSAEGPWEVEDPSAPEVPVHPNCRCCIVPDFSEIPVDDLDVPSEEERDASVADGENEGGIQESGTPDDQPRTPDRRAFRQHGWRGR